ncbi:MAG: biotin/lipoyl-binding protein [Oscillochloris sp.]|nr:biotin/lipoyl-binding protein [Oscillochloris sp.]
MSGRSLLVLALSTVLLAGCAGFGPQPEPTPVVEFEPEPIQIVADARVLPARSAELRFRNNGVIAEILVVEGEEVAADQPLARLDSRELELAVARARSDIEQAEARYEQVAQGATPEEIAAAAAAVEQAEAIARQTRGGVTAQDITAARAELAEARAAPGSTERRPAQRRVGSGRSRDQSGPG